jgi:hypothetical protein
VSRLVLRSDLTVEEPPAQGWFSSPTGSPTGAGTFADPFGPLETLISLTQTLIEREDKFGNTVNPGAVIQPGDTIWLRGGDHGSIETPVRGWHNTDWLYFRAYPGETPIVGQLAIGEVERFYFDGLEVNGDYRSTPYSGYAHMCRVTNINDEGGGWIEFHNCSFKGFEAADPTNLSPAQWWNNCPVGIQFDGQPYVVVNNCTFDKVRQAVSCGSPYATISNCTCSWHRTADAFVMTGGVEQTFTGNTVAGGVYASEEHRDFCQLHQGGTSERAMRRPIMRPVIANNTCIATTRNSCPVVHQTDASGGTWTNPTLGTAHTTQGYAYTTQVVTITTSTHGLVLGDAVWISSASDATALPAQTYMVKEIVSVNQFTVWADVEPTGGPGTLTWQTADYNGPGTLSRTYPNQAVNDPFDLFESGQGLVMFDDAVAVPQIYNNLVVCGVGWSLVAGASWGYSDYHVKNDDYDGPMLQQWPNGYQVSYTSGAPTATTITVTTTAHGVTAGEEVMIVDAEAAQIADGRYNVTAATTNTFSFTVDNPPSPASGALSWTMLFVPSTYSGDTPYVAHNTVYNPWVETNDSLTLATTGAENDKGNWIVNPSWRAANVYTSVGQVLTVSDYARDYYTHTGLTVHVWATGHDVSNGEQVYIRNASGANVPDGQYTATRIDANRFDITVAVEPADGALDWSDGHGRSATNWIRIRNCSDADLNYDYYQIDSVPNIAEFTFTASEVPSPATGILDWYFVNITQSSAPCDYPPIPGEDEFPGLRECMGANNLCHGVVMHIDTGRTGYGGGSVTNSWQVTTFTDCTYTSSGTTVTVTQAGHGASDGDYVYVTDATHGSSIPSQSYQITWISSSQFSFTAESSFGDAGGDLDLEVGSQFRRRRNQIMSLTEFDAPEDQFVSIFPSTLDMHLRAGASAIGAGDSTYATATDLDEVGRGTPPDCGALEYVP